MIKGSHYFSRPFRQRFISAYSPLIFICVDCPRLVFNQRFIAIHSPLIFVCVDCPRLVLSQRFFNSARMTK